MRLALHILRLLAYKHTDRSVVWPILMLTTFGVTHNEYWNMVQNEVTMDDLFWGAMNNAKK